MNNVTTKNDAYLYDNNPNQTKFIPKGSNVELIGTPVEEGYVTVRYKGYNHLLKVEDLNIKEDFFSIY